MAARFDNVRGREVCDSGMVTSRIQATLPWEAEKVWNVVTAVERYTWRSDLSRTERIGERQFVEYTKSGYATTFTITAEEPCRRWEFDMENSNMRGHWTGIFTGRGGETEVEFTEQIAVKNPLLRLFVKGYLRRQQAQFLADLRRALAQPAEE